MMRQKEKKKKGLSFPHVYIMFLLVMLFVVGLSWIVPSGEYERELDPETGVEHLNTEVFAYVANDNPIGFMDFFVALHNGVVQAAAILVVLLFPSGSFFVLETSDAIAAGIHAILKLA